MASCIDGYGSQVASVWPFETGEKVDSRWEIAEDAVPDFLNERPLTNESQGWLEPVSVRALVDKGDVKFQGPLLQEFLRPDELGVSPRIEDAQDLYQAIRKEWEGMPVFPAASCI